MPLCLLQDSITDPPGMLQSPGFQLGEDGRELWQSGSHKLSCPHTHQGVGSREVRREEGEILGPLVQLHQGSLGEERREGEI